MQSEGRADDAAQDLGERVHVARQTGLVIVQLDERPPCSNQQRHLWQGNPVNVLWYVGRKS